MRILVVAPLPPPITGHSLASQVLVDGLGKSHSVEVVNLSIGSKHDGRVSGRRIVEVFKAALGVRRGSGRADAVYVTIAESVAGNVKDLLFYLLCFRRLSTMVLHLHGGSLKRLLFDRHPALERVNRFFMKRMGGAIISGPSHLGIFEGIIPRDRVHLIPNFAQDALFITDAAVQAKFGDTQPLKLLYISGMIVDKGYRALLDGFLALPEDTRRHLHLDFAGKFDDRAEEADFVARIAPLPNVTYHGLVTESAKRELFAKSHVFCLPTAMFEGQPISILEAYASGNVVVTTGQAGIRDVFTDGLNGYELSERTASCIGTVLQQVIAESTLLQRLARHNRATAEAQYRTTTYSSRVGAVLQQVVDRANA